MLDQGTLSCPRFFIVNSRIKIPLWDVHVHFDRAGSHKMSVTDLSLPKVSFYQRTVLVFSVMSISCGRRWTSGTLWNLKRRFAWQMQDMYNCIGMYRAFCHPRGRRGNVAKTWANVCQNERCFWRSLCVALAIFGLRSERVGNVVLWNWCHC